MNHDETLLDTTGRFIQVVNDGRTLEDVSWIPGRIIVSNRRIVLAGNDGNRTIRISEVDELGGRYDANQAITRVPRYTSVRSGKQVVLLTSSRPEEIETALYTALLDHETILTRHPAVEGGVVQDTEWHRAQVKIDPEALNVALADGTFVEIELDDISTLNTGDQSVLEENRQVLKVEHTTEDGTSVRTYLSGTDRHVSFLESLLREGERRSEIGVDLDYREKKVLMALHSGVSSFEIPAVVDMDAEEVERIYDRLIEIDALEEIRKRREVELTARGRKIAGGAMDDE